MPFGMVAMAHKWPALWKKLKSVYLHDLKHVKLKRYLLKTVQVLTNSRYLEVHEVGLFLILGIRIILQSLQEFQKNLLRDLTPSSFQVSESREPEVCIQLMCHRIKWASAQNTAAQLQLRCSKRISLHRVGIHWRNEGTSNWPQFHPRKISGTSTSARTAPGNDGAPQNDGARLTTNSPLFIGRERKKLERGSCSFPIRELAATHAVKQKT